VARRLSGWTVAILWALAGCNGTLVVGLADGGTSATGGSGTSSGGTTGGTTGGTSTGRPLSCAAGLACFDGKCLIANCVGALHDAVCGLPDGGAGVCAGGTCRLPLDGTDDQNCGALGAVCPDDTHCVKGVCDLDAGVVDQSCNGSCPAGMQCEVNSPNLGVACLDPTCVAGRDDELCSLVTLADDLIDPQICCGSRCVDTGSDPSNCGGCGIACGAGEICQAAIFNPAQGTCVPTSCQAQSNDAVCVLDAGQGNCCADAGCTDLLTDPSNCGLCGQSCPTDAGFVCSNGSCLLFNDLGNEVLCDGGVFDCPPGWVCSSHSSTCQPDCSASPDGVVCGASIASTPFADALSICCNHRCVDVGADPANCGSCGSACAPGQTCWLNACEQVDCSETGGQLTPCLGDAGEGLCCSGQCIVGTTTCMPTSCGPNDTNLYCTLPGGAEGVCCDGKCSDLNVEPDNCAFCGLACSIGSTCSGGFCSGPLNDTCGNPGGPQCAPGLSCVANYRCAPNSCEGRSNGDMCLFGSDPLNISIGGFITLGTCCGGRCVDPAQDPGNCGGCGIMAPSGLCFATVETLDPTDCIDAACADFSTDPQHCGNCSVACPTGQTCSGGACSGSPSCGPGHWGELCMPDGGLNAEGGFGQLCCPGFGCRDVSSDQQNCGTCGNACGATQSCRDGRCQ